jgi:hypothetical protein
MATWSLRDGESASVVKNSGGILVITNPEGASSRRVEVRLPNSSVSSGFVAETPVCNAIAADPAHVFVARFNGDVDGYEGRAKSWTRHVANSLTGQDLQLSSDGRTLLVPTRGVSFVVLDTDNGDLLYQYDAGNPTATFNELGVSDVAAEEATKRAQSGEPTTPQQMGAALRADLTAEGHIRFHDATRLKLPFEIDVDPRSRAAIRISAESAVRAALKTAGHADAESPGRSLGLRAPIQINDQSTLAAMVLGNKLCVFLLR